MRTNSHHQWRTGALWWTLALLVVCAVAFPSLAYGDSIAVEKFLNRVPAFTGQNTYKLEYTVSIVDAVAPEKITNVEVKTADALGATVQASRIDDFNWKVVIEWKFESPIDGVIDVEVLTTATEKFKNKMRKRNATLTHNGNALNGGGDLPGFEFKSQSPGIYTLFNDSTEAWDVNRLLVRVNREEVPISAFDLLNPDALSWDFDIPAFTLLPGAVFNLPLGVPLVPNSDVWSQAFVDITGSTSGFRVLDAQEHQHIPEPAPLVMVFAGLLVMLQRWRLLRPAASRASARSH